MGACKHATHVVVKISSHVESGQFSSVVSLVWSTRKYPTSPSPMRPRHHCALYSGFSITNMKSPFEKPNSSGFFGTYDLVATHVPIPAANRCWTSLKRLTVSPVPESMWGCCSTKGFSAFPEFLSLLNGFVLERALATPGDSGPAQKSTAALMRCSASFVGGFSSATTIGALRVFEEEPP